MHHVDSQCHVTASPNGQAVGGASQNPRAIRVTAAVLSRRSYAWTGGAREAIGDDVRAVNNSGFSVATETATSADTRAGARFVSTAVAIDVTRITTSSW